MYSQSDEEKYILAYFKNKEKGRLLEIGAFNPKIYSNSRALILKEWEAVLVEASPRCYKNLYNFYKNDKNIKVYETAIGGYDGLLKFYDSIGALGTACKDHYEKWKKVELGFKIIYIPCITWGTFYKENPGTYNFISIDTEGMDWLICQTINFNETKTELVCVEYGDDEQQIYKYLSSFGFKLVHKNTENIIMGKF